LHSDPVRRRIHRKEYDDDDDDDLNETKKRFFIAPSVESETCQTP
jgi:hypothetical protein